MPSLWWQLLGGPPPPRPALSGDARCDVAVVGAGLTGLWTAWALRRADPSLDVLVLEAEHVGFGASGRNGGWLMGELADGTPAVEALDACQAALEDEGVDCDLVRGGSLTVATSPPQVARLPAGRRLDGAALRRRVRVDGAIAAAFTPHCARVQPAKLVAGLAEAAERRGARIVERTRVERVDPGRVRTAHGEVQARWVVLATEGFTARALRAQRRRLVPLNSAMIATEPLPAGVWDELGWEGGETLLDGAHRYCYLQRTADGRVAIGGRGRPYRFASRTDVRGEVPAATVAELRARLAALFPALRDAPVAAAWSGVLGVARDRRPFVRAQDGLAQAGGYVGEGLTASFLAGLTLADLLCGRDTERTRAPWVGREPPDWEPEPLRWLGVHAVHGLYALADRREARTRRPASAARLADALAGR